MHVPVQPSNACACAVGHCYILSPKGGPVWDLAGTRPGLHLRYSRPSVHIHMITNTSQAPFVTSTTTTYNR